MTPTIALLLTLLVAACGESAPYSRLPAGATVLAFGDSVTYGTGARAGEDYPTRLAELSGWRVINGGMPGDTAREARQRLFALLQEYQPDLVIIELGGNDFLRKRPESRVKEDLEALVLESQSTGAITALVAVPRLSLLRAGVGALDDSEIYAGIADRTGTLLIEDIFSEVLSDDRLRADPIHPNAEGYEILATGIAAQLEQAGLLKR
jgi:acyl-CoA hydrolase